MPINVLIPTYDDAVPVFAAAKRLDALTGSTVGVISNGKHGTVPFFESFADELMSTFGVRNVERVTKPNYSAPAGDEILDAASRWHMLVAGIGD